MATPVIPIKFEFDGKNFEQLSTQMDKLWKDAKKFRDALKAGGGSEGVGNTTAKLKSTVTTMGKLVGKMHDFRKQSQFAGNSILGMTLKMKELKIAHQLATNPKDQRRLKKEIDKSTAAINKAKGATRGWGKAMGSFQFKFNALGNIAANVASSITRNITRALRGAIDTVIDFEKSFAAVLTLLDKGQKLQYGGALKQTSVNIMKKYGLTIEDTNKAMFDAISAGIKVADVYSVLEASAKLAVGGVTDLNSATKGIASVMNAFSLSMDEAGNVASAFFQAQKFGITYINDMVASMGRANTIASLAGASYRDMLSAFTAITKSGLNTEEAITGLRNVFKELVASSGEAAAELSRLGIATGSNAVKARGFIGVLDDLNRAFLNNNEVIPKIFGNIRGLTGIMGIVGKRYETFKFILEQVNDVMASQESLSAAVGEQMGTTAKKVDILKSSWDAFIVSLTESQSEQGSATKVWIEQLTKLVQWLTPDYHEDYAKAIDDAKTSVDDFTTSLEKTSESDEHIKALKDAKDAAEALSNVYNEASKSDDYAKYLEDNKDKIGELTKASDEANKIKVASDEVYTDKLIEGIRIRTASALTESEDAQKIYEDHQKKLTKLRDKLSGSEVVSAWSETTQGLKEGQITGEQYLKLTKKIRVAEGDTDSVKIAFSEKKTIHELLLAMLDELLAKEIKNSEAKDVLSKEERKREINLLKLRRDIDIATIKLNEDGITESINAENKRYEYEKKIIALSIKSDEEVKLMLEKNQLTHDNKMLDIKRKAKKDGINIDSEYNIASIILTTAGYDRAIALAEETNKKKLELIENSNKDKKEKDKEAEVQELNHQIALRNIELRFAIQKADLVRDIAIAELGTLEDSKANQIAIAEEVLKHGLKINQLRYDKGIILLEEYLDQLDLLWLEFDAKRTNADAKADKERIKARDKAFRELEGLIDSMTDVMVDAADRRVDAIQREIDASNERLRSLQLDRDHEWDRMQQGYANNYALKQKELDDEKERQKQLKIEEEKALKNRRKIVNAQIALDMIMTQVQLGLAAAQIFRSATGHFGWIGVAVGAVATAAMIASFAAFQANAKSVTTKLAEGDVDIQGVGTDKSDSIPAMLSKGESVMTAKTTKSNKKTLGFMQNNPNHPLFESMEKHGVNTVFNKLSDDMQNNWLLLNNNPDKWDEKLYHEIKAHNDKIENRPFSFIKGGKTYTIEGNQVTIDG